MTRLVAAGLLNASDAGVAGPTTIDAAPFQLVRRLIKPRRLQGSLQDVEVGWGKVHPKAQFGERFNEASNEDDSISILGKESSKNP